MASMNANAFVNCEDAGGRLWVGQDGRTQYCISKNHMNWWSAHSWCAEVGGELFDMTKECSKYSGNSEQICPQVRGKGFYDSWAWTKHVGADKKVIKIQIGNQAIRAVSPKDTSCNSFALCTIKQ